MNNQGFLQFKFFRQSDFEKCKMGKFESGVQKPNRRESGGFFNFNFKINRPSIYVF